MPSRWEPFAEEWKRLYEKEEWTVEEIALEHGIHTGTVRTQLHRVGTEMRAGQIKGKPNSVHPGSRGDSHSPLPSAPKLGSWRGHRGRSNY